MRSRFLTRSSVCYSKLGHRKFMPRPLDFRTETRAIRFFPFERLFRINQKSNLLNAIRLNFETGYGFGPILIETHYLLQRLKRITLLLRIFEESSIFVQIIFTRIYNFVESHLFKLLLSNYFSIVRIYYACNE